MARAKTKTAPAAGEEKAPSTTARKSAPKKATTKAAPSKESAETAALVPSEHPEGIFSRLTALRDEMDHLFDSMTRGLGFPEFRMPTIELARRPGMVDARFEVSESDQAMEVTAEVPGLDADEIEVTLSEGVLTVKGEKRDTREEKGKDYHVSERRYGSFSRAFRVPETIDEGKISASFDKGVLSITLPKQASAKRRPKSIQIAKA
jgi:HSP20 family protein